MSEKESSNDAGQETVQPGSEAQHKGRGRERDVKRRGSRYRARRRAVDILFEAEARDLDPVAIVEDRVQLARDPENQVAPVHEYSRVIVSGAAEKLDDIDDAIERFLSADWELGRLPAVDRAILRVCTWEIMFNDEVDGPISVVEGVEMASEYSGNHAPPYIHAVLDDIVQVNKDNAPTFEHEPTIVDEGSPDEPFVDDDGAADDFVAKAEADEPTADDLSSTASKTADSESGEAGDTPEA